MGKLKPLPQHKVIRILKNNGFKKVRSRKHITFKKKISSDKILTTWVSHEKEITVFTIKYIIRQTEKLREEFY